MGSFEGHVAPGFGFFLIGLWHLFNHTKLHALSPNTYKSLPWFPTSKSKYLELTLIMFGSLSSIAMELFIGPKSHQPFDPDGTIPSNHLHNFEHSTISLTFFTYAFFSIILDKTLTKHKKTLHDFTQLLGALAFAQQLLLFHLHSADHLGVEGQYHLLLQIFIFVSLATTLMGITYPNSFILSFVRSLSILAQGLWFIHMGFMLWTRELMPKGCFMNLEEGHLVVRCADEGSLHRAKSLVNLQFSLFLIAIAFFAMCFYLGMVKFYGKGIEYVNLSSKVENEDEDDSEGSEDIEAQKNMTSNIAGDHQKSFIQMGNAFGPIDIER